MKRVEGKIALVTGGAKGIGAATARLLAAEGATVIVADVDEPCASRLVDEICRASDEAQFMHLDVSDEDAWIALLEAVKAQHGGLDILVNNAGITFSKTVEQTTLADWKRLMSVNLESVFLGTKYALPLMKGRQASIINISSVEGIVADPQFAAYNASKGGVRLLTKSVALHCAKSKLGIRVNSVHPGAIMTPMVEGFIEEIGDEKAVMDALNQLHPLGRIGEPIDIAYGVLYLASDESKFVTGSELVIDGGYTAQ